MLGDMKLETPAAAVQERPNGHAQSRLRLTPISDIATDLISAWNTHDPHQIDALFSSDCVLNDCAIAEPLRGHRGLRRAVLFNFLAFPDVRFEMVSQVCQGDRIALEWRATGTQRGRFMGIPATGRAVILDGVTLLTVRDGLICHLRRMWDIAGVIRQLGLLPELPTI